MDDIKEMTLDSEMYVAMHNDLVRSKSELSLNEIKLLRLAILQITKKETDFQTYKVPITELSELLDIPSSNMYRDIQNICIHLKKEILLVGDGNPKHKWKVFSWVDSIKYEDGIITIKLSDDLKPYLLCLSGLYTQYLLEDILYLKSVYSIRLYELIRQEMKFQKVYADKSADIVLSEETIRKATNTDKKYDKHSMFRARVIDAAVEEISQKTPFTISYVPVKKSRKVIGYNFHIESRNNIKH